MAAPIYTTSSRALLQRFFARESRRALLSREAALTNPSASASASASGSASTSTGSSSTGNDDTAAPAAAAASSSASQTSVNPFASSLSRNAAGRPKYRKAIYSLRRQKQLHRAMDVVKLQEELFASPGEAEVVEEQRQQDEGATAHEESASSVLGRSKMDWSVPASWTLPKSRKTNSMPSFMAQLRPLEASEASSSSSSIAPRRRSTSASSPSKSTFTSSSDGRPATKRGPYKGRRGPAFKLHKWERDKESILKEREEKLKNMPQRIDEYTKARAASRRDQKPSLPF